MFKGIILIFYVTFMMHTAFSQCYVNVNPVPQNNGCFQANSEAVWINNANANVNGNDVSKSNNINTWNAFANTSDLIQDNMSMSTIVAEDNTYKLVSITTNTGTTSPADNDFCFYLQGNGVLSVAENNSILANIGNYYTGDTLKILADNGVVKYFQNGSLVYTSAQVPSFPMAVEVNLYSPNATVKEVIISANVNDTFLCSVGGFSSVYNYQWSLNGLHVGTNSSTYVNSNLNDNDIITCVVLGLGFCNVNASNGITIKAAPSDNMTATVVPTYVANSCVKTEFEVSWTDELNVLFQNNQVSRANGQGWGGSGVASSSELSDNMYASTVLAETNTDRLFGLSHQNTNANWNTIDFGVYLSAQGGLSVYESGTYKGSYGNYNTGDTLQIHVEAGIVNYYLNSSLFYTSNSAPTLPLIIDISINSNGGSFSAVKIGGLLGGTFTCQTNNMGSNPTYLWYLNGVSTNVSTVSYTNNNLTSNDLLYCAVNPSVGNCSSIIIASNSISVESNTINDMSINIHANVINNSCLRGVTPVNWEDNVGLTIDGNNLLNNVSTGVWVNGAFSTVPVLDNMGVFTVIAETNKRRFFGLSSTNIDENYTSIAYAVYLNGAGNLSIYESGNYRGSFGAYTANDSISIQVNNGVVAYFINDNLLYSSNISPSLPLYSDVSFNEQNATLKNVSVFYNVGDTFTCETNNAGVNPTFEWVLNNQVVGSNSATYTNVNLTELDTLYCNVIPDVNSCSNVVLNSNVFYFDPIGIQKTYWEGLVSNNWNDAGNWSNGLPSSTTKAFINGLSTNQPVVNGVASCAGLTIGQNNSLNIIGTDTFKVFGAWVNEGVFTGNVSNVAFNSNCANAIGFYNLLPQNFNNIIVNDGIKVNQLGGTIFLKGALSLENGDYDTNDSLVLLSDVDATARITEIKNGTLTGKIEMQRFIDAGATNWRFLTQAVAGQNLESFDDDFITSGIPGSDFPNFPSVANPFSSFYFYDETAGVNYNDGFIVPSSTLDAVGMGEGVWIWCGDSLQGTNPFTIDAYGPIYQGDLNLPVTYTPTAGNSNEDGWNMVANPYPCTVDWDATDWVKTNIDAAIFIWNPDNAQYASYVAGVGTNLGDNKIASSQAFWVHSNGASPQLTIKESCKVNLDHGFIKKASYQPQLLRLKLNANSTDVWDESVIRMAFNTTNDFDSDFDALKFYSGDANSIQIASTLNNKDYTINSVNPDSITAIDLKIILPNADVCTISTTDISGIANMACVLLEDLNTGAIINLKEDSTFQFQQTAYNYQPRLRIHFTKKPKVSISNPSCYGSMDGSLLLDVPSGVNDTYWTNSVGDSIGTGYMSNLSQGTYYLQYDHLIAACGSGLDSFVLASPSPLHVQSVSTNINCNTCCDGTAALNVTGGTAPYSFVWPANANSNGNDGFDLCDGTYAVIVMDNHHCDTTVQVVIENTLTVEDGPSNNSIFNVYPNPTMAKITIEGSDLSLNNLRCFNSVGQEVTGLVQIQNLQKNRFSANLESLPAGIYFLEHKNSTYKITKN
ncbi:hypothetical protein DNU06_11385 [Putridiphycobacter roseus]|uniref:Ig-like domain-containing protein n=1 Tax=Putridiphycobacter roseus TaxID=2219161 RepID=A0A2W1NMH5_9FLAO|nr:T9SS type A sorting domain-containing protein [Putridiphycobacter roseus]PZE16852.1 hypothetical protein DNU06_11385 [Putridiphycobacter roseus]